MNFSQKLLLLTFLILLSNIHAVKRFIFRLDDIQDWYYSSAQQQLLNWFMNNNIPVTAGIISDVFTAEDPDLYPVLQRCAGMTKDKCALFNHGRNGAYLFANAPSVADAQAQIQACDDTITTYFPGYQVELFVPHQNSWNQYTLQAVRNVGYLAISASVLSYSNLPWNLFSNPLQLSQQTETGEYNPNGWTAWPIATAVSDCDAATARGEDCVIMVHPYEFGDGTYTFAMLQDLINRLKAKGYTATSFHTVIQEAKGLTNSPTRSPTLKPTTVPTAKPSTRAPTAKPTIKPTITPGASVAPTVAPTQAVVTGTPVPTVTPTRSPTSATTKKRFILRLDDIQDWYFSSWQQQILTWLMDRGYPVSAGIIGDYFDAQDPALYPVLKRCAGMTKDKCALFNHGKDAAYIFANSLSVAEAQAQILSCDTKIKTYFPGYQVDLFVPHQNSWNSYVLQAVRNLGYSAISASTLSYSNLPQSLTTNPIQLSQQTETGEYNPDGTWSAWPIDTAVADCEAAMARGDAACVIMMHPFEFGNGKYTFAMLQQLIDKLTALGYSATSFDTVIREVKNIPGSPTMAPTTAVPTRPPTVSPTVNPLLTAPAWGQCGGLLYLGPTTCVNGYTCVLSSIWYSQCKPANVADVVASLTYEIKVPIADIQGNLFSTSSEAAIMLAIRNIEENAGHHVDDLVVKSVQQISGVNRKLRTIDREQLEIQPASSASNVFKVTLAMTLLVENGQTAKNIYTDSTSALTTSVKNGLLQTQFRNYALKFDASESKRGSITSMSFSNYDYNNAPDSSTTKTNDKAKTVNMFIIAIPIGVGLLLFVVISYLVLGYYRRRNELTKKAHHDEIFATFSDNIFKDYKVSTQEHNSMEFLSDNFIYRHGMGSDIQYSTVASKSVDIDVATNCDTVSECASVIVLNDV